MALLPLLFTFSSAILLLLSTASATTTRTTSTLGKDQVPNIMCYECEHPHSPPPPVIECPPPPSPPPPIPPSPPPPSPPPPIPPSPPPPVVECPPPPKRPKPQSPPPPQPVVISPPPPRPECGGGGIDCLLPPMPGTPDKQEYLSPPRLPYPPGTLDLDEIINGAKMLRFSYPSYFSLQAFTFLILLWLPYYLFI